MFVFYALNEAIKKSDEPYLGFILFLGLMAILVTVVIAIVEEISENKKQNKNRTRR